VAIVKFYADPLTACAPRRRVGRHTSQSGRHLLDDESRDRRDRHHERWLAPDRATMTTAAVSLGNARRMQERIDDETETAPLSLEELEQVVEVFRILDRWGDERGRGATTRGIPADVPPF
jgi:hypothetical protein